MDINPPENKDPCKKHGREMLTDISDILIGLQQKYLLSRNVGANSRAPVTLSSGVGLEYLMVFLPRYRKILAVTG